MARQGHEGLRYQIGEIPAKLDENFLRWVADELRKIQAAHDAVADGNLEVHHVEPSKPRTGRVVFADGTDWDPGSGRGPYVYDEDGPSWIFLG